MVTSCLNAGLYFPAAKDHGELIVRERYREGFIFKDYLAFLYTLDKVCYVPEYTNTRYTRQDFLNLCRGQPEIARRCFEEVDGEHLKSWLAGQFEAYKLALCPQCGRLYEIGGFADKDRPCPVCGAKQPDSPPAS